MITTESIRLPNAHFAATEVFAERLIEGSIRTMVLRGAPGTGKTTLAQELLRIKGRGTYISTSGGRGGGRELFEGVKDVVFENVDSAFASPWVSVLERPGPRRRVDHVLELVRESLESRPKGMIVIDSWQRIAKELDSVQRYEIEMRLVASAEASDSMLLIIDDLSSDESLEFLVDGVIELKRSLHAGEVLRELEIKKLSRLPTPRPLMIFTLVDGRFRLFEPPQLLLPGQYKPVQFQMIRHPEGLYSWGTPDLDLLTGGGVPRGSSMTYELGPGVSPAALIPLLQARLANFVQNGGCAVGVPSSGSPPEDNLGPLRSILPQGSVESNVRFGYYRDYGDRCTFLLNIDSVDQTFQRIWQNVTEMKGPKQRPCLFFLGVDKLVRIHGDAGVLRNIVISITRTKFNKDYLTMLVDSTLESKDAISAITEFHFRVENHSGVLTLQPVKPAGPLHILDYDYTRGYPQVNLVPLL